MVTVIRPCFRPTDNQITRPFSHKHIEFHRYYSKHPFPVGMPSEPILPGHPHWHLIERNMRDSFIRQRKLRLFREKNSTFLTLNCNNEESEAKSNTDLSTSEKIQNSSNSKNKISLIGSPKVGPIHPSDPEFPIFKENLKHHQKRLKLFTKSKKINLEEQAKQLKTIPPVEQK